MNSSSIRVSIEKGDLRFILSILFILSRYFSLPSGSLVPPCSSRRFTPRVLPIAPPTINLRLLWTFHHLCGFCWWRH